MSYIQVSVCSWLCDRELLQSWTAPRHIKSAFTCFHFHWAKNLFSRCCSRSLRLRANLKYFEVMNGLKNAAQILIPLLVCRGCGDWYSSFFSMTMKWSSQKEVEVESHFPKPRYLRCCNTRNKTVELEKYFWRYSLRVVQKKVNFNEMVGFFKHFLFVFKFNCCTWGLSLPGLIRYKIIIPVT